MASIDSDLLVDQSALPATDGEDSDGNQMNMDTANSIENFGIAGTLVAEVDLTTSSSSSSVQKSDLYTLVTDQVTGKLKVVWKDHIPTSVRTNPGQSPSPAPTGPFTSKSVPIQSTQKPTTTGSKAPLIIVSPVKTPNSVLKKPQVTAPSYLAASVTPVVIDKAPVTVDPNIPRVVTRKRNKQQSTSLLRDHTDYLYPHSPPGSSNSSLSGSLDDDDSSYKFDPSRLLASGDDFDAASISSNFKDMLQRNIGGHSPIPTPSVGSVSSRNSSASKKVVRFPATVQPQAQPPQPPKRSTQPPAPLSSAKLSTPSKKAPSEILQSTGSILRTGTPKKSVSTPQGPHTHTSSRPQEIDPDILQLGKLYFTLLVAAFGIMIVAIIYDDFGLSAWYSSNNAAFSVVNGRALNPFIYPRDYYDNSMLNDPLFTGVFERKDDHKSDGLFQLYSQPRKVYGSSKTSDNTTVHMSTSDEKIVKALIDVNILEPAYNTVVESTWARWEIQGMAFQPSPSSLEEFYRVEGQLRGRDAANLTKVDWDEATSRILHLSMMIDRNIMVMPQSSFKITLDNRLEMKVDLATYDVLPGAHELRISAMLECNPDYDGHGYRLLTASTNSYFYYFPREKLQTQPQVNPESTSQQTQTQSQSQVPQQPPPPVVATQSSDALRDKGRFDAIVAPMLGGEGLAQQLSSSASVASGSTGAYVSPFNFLSQSLDAPPLASIATASKTTAEGDRSEVIPVIQVTEPVAGATISGKVQIKGDVIARYLLSSRLVVHLVVDKENKADITKLIRSQVDIKADLIAPVSIADIDSVSNDPDRGSFLITIEGLTTGRHSLSLTAYEIPAVIPLGQNLEDVLATRAIVLGRNEIDFNVLQVTP